MSRITTKRQEDALQSVERDSSLLSDAARTDRINDANFEEGKPLLDRSGKDALGHAMWQRNGGKTYHTVPKLPWLEKKA